MDEQRDATTQAFLTYVLLPAWLIAGLLDWYWHRMTRIERTAGVPESLLHLLMGLESGVGTLAGLFLEASPGVIVFTFGAALVHEATVALDVAFAQTRRQIPQIEQHTHSFLEVLPFVTSAFVAFMYPKQTQALLSGNAEMRLRLKRTPMTAVSAAALIAAGSLGIAPYLEELVRCLLAGPDKSEQ